MSYAVGAINAGSQQSPQMFFPQLGIDDREGSVPAREPVPDEGKWHPILLVQIVKEGTDVTCFQGPGVSTGNGRRGTVHREFLGLRQV